MCGDSLLPSSESREAVMESQQCGVGEMFMGNQSPRPTVFLSDDLITDDPETSAQGLKTQMPVWQTREICVKWAGCEEKATMIMAAVNPVQ